MKNFVVLIIELCVVFLLFSNTVFANKYYFSSSIGNDSYSEVEAQNPATPWKTLGKLNSIMSILAPGDSVLFKKGDVFYGKIVVTKSGTSSQPIVFSSFGSGEEPLITGLTELFNWNSVGGGIMAANCNDCRETNNMLLFDNKLQRIGRYPNSGYLQYQSFSGTNSITSDQLPAGIDWTGAELVVRKKDWILERNKITSQQGGTLYFSTDSKYPGTNNYGFFIQRDRRTLDSLGEWYFVKESKAMWVYFGRENPADHQVKVSTIDTLVYILRQSYITFDGIAFEGGSQYTISINYSKFIKIQNSTLNYSGNRAIKCGGCEDFTLANSSISNTLNVGVDLTYSGVRTNIINNHIKNTGCIEGLGDGGMDSYMGISPAKDFSRISNNRIDSTGFVPIRFNESNTIVEENFINTFCFIKDDAGGIYTSGPHEKDQEPIIRNNIVVNGIGAPNGANGRVIVRGIYADEFSSHVSIIGNTVAKVNGGGIFLHRANNVDVENNKSFDNLYCIMYHQRKLGEFFSNTIKNNQFVAKNNDQVAVFFYMEDGSDNPSTWGTIDSNYYSRPNNEDSRIVRVAAGAEVRYFNPAGWNLYSGLDKASGPSKAVGDSMSEVRLVYNPSNVEKSYSLDGTYQSIDGNFYYGSVTLPPYQSVILVKLLEINKAPIANAGPEQIIILPQDKVTLVGSGTDEDGEVVGYEWTKSTWSIPHRIVTSNSPVTEVTGLSEGTFIIQLKVTDNKGASATSSVRIIVKAAPNKAPTANAGQNQTITLPINTVTLNGSGTDEDGTITAYEWTKVSGPNSYTIVSPASATTEVKDLTEGSYTFQLKVTDNKGATGTATVKVTVNPAPNKPPKAYAGADKTITLPTSTVSLAGSGEDEDGTIVSYKWTKVSGPSAYNIVNPNSAVTDAFGLVEGVYEFQLEVTDNKGAKGRDTMKVTVNAAPNKAPKANAGQNQTITLPTNTVTLNGIGTDEDGTITAYEWTKTAGPNSYTIVSPNYATTEVKNLTEGTYTFQLKVTDDKGATGTATVKVTVNPAPNKAPTANAGQNQTITLPINTVTLNGSGTDEDGSITAYEWTKTAGPTSYTIVSPNSATTEVRNLTEGTYTFQLKVTDDKGATGTATVKVTVNPAPNKAPTANAGQNQTITLPTSTVTLNGSGTDEDGTITAYEWTKTAGPTGYTIVSPNSATTEVRNLTEGTYTFQLKVTDNRGTTGTATVKVTVNPAPNKPPKAYAGADKTITLPTSTVSLAGSGEDEDGTIVSYNWTKVKGPSAYNIVNPNSAVTDAFGLVEGVYEFQLEVTDNKGAKGRDTMKVTVNAVPNKAPKANAGQNQTITLPTNTVTLSGSGTDEDGTITGYQWSKVSGPVSYSITSPSSATTEVTGLVEGTYKFRLKVTDNKGATGTADVTITVKAGSNQKPIANAGGNKTIVYPENSVILTGSGSDVDGIIASFNWRQLSGPSNANILSINKAQTEVSDLVVGNYEFELTVTNDKGATGRDTMLLMVASAREMTYEKEINIYPNPTKGLSILEIMGVKITERLVVLVSDGTGKVLERREVYSGGAYSHKEQIDFTKYRNGMYFITVISEGRVRAVKRVLRL